MRRVQAVLVRQIQILPGQVPVTKKQKQKTKKGERQRITRAARQVATEAYTKFKADCLTFLGKEIRTTKESMDKTMERKILSQLKSKGTFATKCETL